MKKCEVLLRPDSCLNKAATNEPVFVLRAKDPVAAQAVRLWASMAEGLHEGIKVEDALKVAATMDEWREDMKRPVCASEAAAQDARPIAPYGKY